MLLMKLFILIGNKGKMKFTFAEIVRFCTVAKPGELQRKVTGAVTKIDQLEGSIRITAAAGTYLAGAS